MGKYCFLRKFKLQKGCNQSCAQGRDAGLGFLFFRGVKGSINYRTDLELIHTPATDASAYVKQKNRYLLSAQL